MAWPEFIFIFAAPGKGELSESEDLLFSSLVLERRWLEAVQFLEMLLRDHPDFPPVLNALAYVAYENRDYETAFRLVGSLVKRFPENPLWMNNFGVVEAVRGEMVIAKGAFQHSYQASAGRTEAHYNLGCLSVCEGELTLARSIFRGVIAVEPENIRALFALSRIAKELGLVAEAIFFCRKLVELSPEKAEFRQNLGLLLLKTGAWREGFALYEARWQANRLSMLSPERLWQGQALAGKTILVWDEQGLGDTIHFARYIPMLQEQKGVVVVSVQEVLLGLLSRSFPEFKVVGRRAIEGLDYDFQVPFLSLFRLLPTEVESVPATVPYLKIDDRYREKWHTRLMHESCLRVGVVWAGNPRHANDAKRSIPLALFAQLFAVAGVKFFGLKKERDTGDLQLISTLPPTVRDRFVDLAEDLEDFQDTAAILENLDLLISVDTSVPHLAGALARPVWLLLPFDADWRWLVQREDSPWYPTMRLFRQPQPGAWQPVVERLCRRLQEVVRGKADL